MELVPSFYTLMPVMGDWVLSWNRMVELWPMLAGHYPSQKGIYSVIQRECLVVVYAVKQF